MSALDDALADRLRTGVLAIVRLPDGLDPVPAALAVVNAGVRAVEITLTTAGAADSITRLVDTGENALVGAGSVRSVEDVRIAAEAGAAFLVTPSTSPDVIAAATARGIPVVAGGLSPTELDTAHRCGAAYQKLFPASLVGPRYLQEVLSPMPDLQVIPTGGVGPGDVAAWRRAGAVAVAVGSALVEARTVAAGDLTEIHRRARQLLREWAMAELSATPDEHPVHQARSEPTHQEEHR